MVLATRLLMKLRLAFFAVVACCGSVLGQQTTPAPAPPAGPPSEAGLKIRGLTFQLENPPTDVFAHDAAGNGKVPGVKLDVKSYLNHEFSAVPISGENLILTKSADPAGIKDTASIVAKAKLPVQFKTGIFMFLPGTGKAGDPPFRVLVIEDSYRDFPQGAFKVLNLSPMPVQIQLEKKEFNFKPGETQVIEDPPVGANNSSGMEAFSFKDGKPQRIAAGVWPHPGQKRSIQVLSLNPKSGQVELRGIRDVAGPP